MNLPDGWEIVKIGQVATVSSGSTPDRGNSQYWGGNVNWVSTGEINYKTIHSSEEKITDLALKESSMKISPVGSILMAMYGQGSTRGRVAKLAAPAATNQNACSIVADPNLCSEYLYFFLERNYDFIRSLSNGGGQHNLNNGIVRNIILPLPPFSEQLQIATILSQWDDSLSILTKLLEAKRQQKRGLAEQLLTGKRRLKGFEGTWESKAIGDLFSEVTRFIKWDDSRSYTQAIVRRWSQGITTRDELEADQIKVKKLQQVKSGDFLISNIQAAYGAMAKVTDREAGLFISNLYTVLKSRPGLGNIDFLDQLSRTSLMESLVIAASNGFKAERVRLNFDSKTFLKQRILTPPSLSEQQAITSILSTLDEEITTLNALKAKVQEQKRGLMDLLLTGKVRVNVDELSVAR